MRILLTGAGGFLGEGLIQALEENHTLRLMDVVPFENRHEVLCGDVCNADDVARAVEGMDALVIAHMAPNRPEVYATPEQPCHINITGTAMLYAAAAGVGIKTVVLVSSTAPVAGYMADGLFLRRDLPPRPTSIYGMTKVCQEEVARTYYEMHGIQTAVLRPAYITNADTLVDKYGHGKQTVNWQFIDRRDIGFAAEAALNLPDLTFEIFYVLGHPDAANHADMDATRTRLDWTPKYDFQQYAEDDG